MVVRMDPEFIARPIRDRIRILNTCNGPCAHNMFLAGQNKGGRYGNHYDLTYNWYKKQFIDRTIEVAVKNKTESYSGGSGMFLPAFAITDKDGDIRYLRDGFDSQSAHAALMHVLGKKPNRTEASLRDFGMPLGKRNWIERLVTNTSGLIGSIVVIAIILAALFGAGLPKEVVIVERKKR